MKMTYKRSFYLEPEIEAILAKSPSKKMSERANELMRKGLQKEREEAVAAEYKRYGEALAQHGGQDQDEPSSTLLSYRLFEDEDPDKDLS